MPEYVPSEKTKHADYLRNNYGLEVSPFGEIIAELMGVWRGGMHHFPKSLASFDKSITRVKWNAPNSIEIALDFTIDSYDHNEMARLYFLCCDLCVRAELFPRMNVLYVNFTQRHRSNPHAEGTDEHKRWNDWKSAHYHPTAEESLAQWRVHHPLPSPLPDSAEVIALKAELREAKRSLRFTEIHRELSYARNVTNEVRARRKALLGYHDALTALHHAVQTRNSIFTAEYVAEHSGVPLKQLLAVYDTTAPGLTIDQTKSFARLLGANELEEQRLLTALAESNKLIEQ